MLTKDRAGNEEAVEKTREPALKFSWINRDRWNVLDLLNLYGMQAITTHVFYDINMQWVEETRKAMNKKVSETGKEAHVTVTAFLLKAIALAQLNHPASRTLLLPGLRMVTFEEIVAGFTVEREVNGSPVVFFGEIEGPVQKSISELAGELKDYSEKDFDEIQRLKEQRIFTRFPWILRQLIFHVGAWVPRFRLMCMRATFGLSSLGALGVRSVFGPSVCTSVFGVGAVEDRVIVESGKVVARPMMTLALSFDQRVMDGGEAAEFVLEIKELLEGGMKPHIEDELNQ